eukprot:TRINITY_DN23225_c0_g1_i1.p1 TRINITY_DN23225_c0_g1~~TRINITY_DN23225_c0_g1_i1.p1  ORF type:complete len:173 (+),score=4.80 TRINITY_DN23225_c0_g1_i1:55-519(+)
MDYDRYYRFNNAPALPELLDGDRYIKPRAFLYDAYGQRTYRSDPNLPDEYACAGNGRVGEVLYINYIVYDVQLLATPWKYHYECQSVVVWTDSILCTELSQAVAISSPSVFLDVFRNNANYLPEYFNLNNLHALTTITCSYSFTPKSGLLPTYD